MQKINSLQEPKRAILRIVQKHEGELNWYQVHRAAFDIFAEHPDLKPSEFIADGLLEEKPVSGEPLPRIHTTALGRTLLS